MRSTERREINVLEMKCMNSLVGVSQMDRVRNEAGIERKLASRKDQKVLRWFGHLARMVLMAEVECGYERDRG